MNDFCFQLYLCPPSSLKSTWIQNATVSCIAYKFCFPVLCSIIGANYLFGQGQTQKEIVTVFGDDKLLNHVNQYRLVGMPIFKLPFEVETLN